MNHAYAFHPQVLWVTNCRHDKHKGEHVFEQFFRQGAPPPRPAVWHSGLGGGSAARRAFSRFRAFCCHSSLFYFPYPVSFVAAKTTTARMSGDPASAPVIEDRTRRIII